ncbi:DUF4435 domain-containing protein [Hafnia paralvei]|uniref:DUF4435 domain-containing protein n=1 Tax=Hafnia paralvei TaxID=546367 RepID=UPI0024B961CC|nr:DUF4435 domain-containing protein [Hafnia paralvei]
MGDLPRRSIEDLKTRYFVEPNLFDVYVEGAFDQLAINSWCEKNSDKSIVPYDIDSVEIPYDVLAKYNLTEGKKQRVIALAKELASIDCNSYKCVVDRDLDHWFGELDNVPQLLWTDFSSLEMYFFSEQLIKRIMVDISGCKVKNWHEFYESFIFVLKQLYSIRLTSKNLNLDCSWCDTKKSLSIEQNRLIFDITGYISKNLIAVGLKGQCETFLGEHARWMAKMDCDPRLCIRGHDFVDLMANAIKEYKGLKSFQDSEVLQRMLLAFIDEIDMLIQNLK